MDILGQIQSDLDSALGFHTEVIGQMESNFSLYAGEQYGDRQRQDSTSAKWYESGFKLKDIKRAVEGSLPDLVEPFVANDKIVDITANDAAGVDKAQVLTTVINRQFTKSQEKLEFIETVAKDLQIDGTVFCKVGWGDNQAIVENVPANELILDPSARRMKDLRFAIQRRKVMFQSIVDNSSWFGEHTEQELSVLEATTETEFDRDREGSYGVEDSFNFDDRPRQLIEVFEYYGMLDIGNGLEPVLCIWSDNLLLRATPSPYPKSWNGIPFESAVYSRVPHNIYGTGLPEMLMDYANLRDKMMRGVIDNMDRATNGQKFVRKGGMDNLSFRKMMDGSPVVWTNRDPGEVIMDGGYNEIPQSIFALMEGMKTEQEELSGIGRLNSGLDPRALNSGTSATAANIVNDNSQKRLLQVARHISEMMERVFYKYVDMNQLLLKDGSVEIGGASYSVNGSELEGSYDATITAGTAGKTQEKLGNITMMIQQLMPMSGQLPPKVTMGLLTDMAHLLNMPTLTAALDEVMAGMEQSEGQPNPMQEMGMQMEMAEKQADIAATNAKAQKDEADAVNTMVETERLSYTPIGEE